MSQRSLVANRFEISGPPLQGGMGEVYKAIDRETDRVVALKLLRNVSRAGLVRFGREAELLALLRHPGIVQYIAHGDTPRGPYLVMEWLDGEDLQTRLGRGPLTVAETITVGLAIAEALRVAHWRGVVHRDLKPSNLFLVGGDLGRLRVLDFGIARFADTAVGLVTETGLPLGSPGYMAPEQARGEREIGPSADVFSLGAVLFHCLTERPPFLGESAVALLLKVVLEAAPDVRSLTPECPPALDELIGEMLSKPPGDRPSDAAVVAERLQQLWLQLGDSANGAAPPSKAKPALTDLERRVSCALILRFAEAPKVSTEPFPNESPNAGNTPKMWPAAGPESGATIPRLAGTEPLAERSREVITAQIRLTLMQFSANVDAIDADATMYVVTWPTDPTVAALSAAGRAALALRQDLPAAAIAIVARRTTSSAFRPGAFDALYQLVATAGEIRLDEASAALLENDFVIERRASEALGERRREQPVAVLRQLRDTESVGRPLLGRDVPFVGRQSQLEELMDGLQKGLARGPRLMLLIGPAGSGKSRLRGELAARIGATPKPSESWPPAIWLTAGETQPASQSPGEPARASSLAPFAALVRRLAGIFVGEPGELSRHKLAIFANQFAQGDVYIRTVSFLGELCGVPFPPGHCVELQPARYDPLLMATQVRLALETMVTASLKRQPICLIVDDAHRVDASTLDVIRGLFERIVSAPLVVIACGPPEIKSMWRAVGDDRPLTVTLPPMTEAESTEMVRRVVGDSFSDVDVERIVRRAQGNPFFLEELMRALASTGEGETHDGDLPDAVFATIDLRLGRLSDNDRRVIRAASIVGPVFWRGAIVPLLGGKARTRREHLDESLDALQDAELIRRLPRSRVTGEDEYEFRHALLRDAAYQMLVDDDRRLGHRLVVEWLKSVGLASPDVAAHHYEAAGDKEHAAGAAVIAAHTALAQGDSNAAIGWTAFGLRLAPGGPSEGPLRAAAVEALVAKGAWQPVVQTGQLALAALPVGCEAWSRVAGHVASAHHRRLSRPDLVELGERLLNALVVDSDAELVRAAVQTAEMLVALEERPVGGALVDRLIDIIPPDSVAYREAANAIRALVANDLRANGEAIAKAGRAFEKAGDRPLAVAMRIRLSEANLRSGLVGEALKSAGRAVTGAEGLGLPRLWTAALLQRGSVRLAHEETSLAIADLENVLSRARSDVDQYHEGLALLELARACRTHARSDGREQAARAAELATMAFDLLRSLPGRAAEAMAVRARAELLATGSVDAAVGRTLARYAAAADIDWHPEIALAEVEVLVAEGARDLADERLATARIALEQRAAQLPDQGWRNAFLSLPLHRELLKT